MLAYFMVHFYCFYIKTYFTLWEMNKFPFCWKYYCKRDRTRAIQKDKGEAIELQILKGKLEVSTNTGHE